MAIEEDEFDDAMGRRIRFEVAEDIVAYHEGREVGRIQLEDVEIDDHLSFTRLFGIDVDEEYRRAGIGVELVRRAVAEHGAFARPRLDALGSFGRDSRDYFTPEGAALFRHCIALGIVNDDRDD